VLDIEGGFNLGLKDSHTGSQADVVDYE